MKKKKICCSIEQVREVLESRCEVTNKEVETVLDSLLSVSTSLPNWLVIVLKIIAYAIGLFLAGYGTTAAAQTFISL